MIHARGKLPVRQAEFPKIAGATWGKLLYRGGMTHALKLFAALLLAGQAPLPAVEAPAAGAKTDSFDVVVYGGTPAGITAAIAASRDGASAILIEPSAHLGGMVTGGLSRTDYANSNVIGGLAKEFFRRADASYADAAKTNSATFWNSEPHVAERIYHEMLKEAGVTVVIGQPLQETVRADGVITSIRTKDDRMHAGKIFVDATYEGDLMAQAGVKYVVGREGRDEYGESLAGFTPAPLKPRTVEYMATPKTAYTHGTICELPARDAAGKLYWGVSDKPWPAPGSGDKLVQSYNFRVIGTDDPPNRVPFPKPQNYYPERYELLLQMIQKFPGIRFAKIVYLGGVIPGKKVDINASGLIFSTDHLGANTDYPEGDAATRARIFQDHKDYIQGLFWFLQNDGRVPADLREQVAQWGLAKDEFVDNDHWPYALYVREARRMVGAYVMRQQDCQTETTKPDVIGMASFILDSHAYQRVVTPEGFVTDEGNFDIPCPPYQIPYRAITPVKEQCRNLLVPVCLSATHVALGSIRMEAHYMNLGHAAGLAAASAIRSHSAVQDISIPALQARLLEMKQVLSLSAPVKDAKAR